MESFLPAESQLASLCTTGQSQSRRNNATVCVLEGGVETVLGTASDARECSPHTPPGCLPTVLKSLAAGVGQGMWSLQMSAPRKALKWFYHWLCHIEKVSNIPRSLLKSPGKEYLKKILSSIFACPTLPAIHCLPYAFRFHHLFCRGKYLLKSSVPTEGDHSCLSSVSIFLQKERSLFSPHQALEQRKKYFLRVSQSSFF